MLDHLHQHPSLLRDNFCSSISIDKHQRRGPVGGFVLHGRAGRAIRSQQVGVSGVEGKVLSVVSESRRVRMRRLTIPPVDGVRVF